MQDPAHTPLRKTIREITTPRSMQILSFVVLINLCVLPSQAWSKDPTSVSVLNLQGKATKNRFAGLTDHRRHWLPATTPPTKDEIDKYPGLFLEGNWRIEWSNHPDFQSAEIWLTKGLMLDTICGVKGNYETSCRDPDAPLKVHSAGAVGKNEDGSIRKLGHAFSVKVSPDGGEFEIQHRGAPSGAIATVLQRQTGEPDIMVGTWHSGDDKTGEEIWRREPRPHITTSECVSGKRQTVGNTTTPCVIEIPDYPAAGAMRGNLPSMRIRVFGSNMWGAGPLPVYMDWDRTTLEVNGYCYLHEKPFAEGQRHGCASWGHPHEVYGQIIGVEISINVVYGAKPGIKTLWIGGNPVPFQLDFPDLPDDLNENFVNLKIRSNRWSQHDAKEVEFLIQNHGKTNATDIQLALSAEQAFCPYEGGCTGESDGLSEKMTFCPFGDMEQPFDCSQCSLTHFDRFGNPRAIYECPNTKLRPGDVAEAMFIFDPRAKAHKALSSSHMGGCPDSLLLSATVVSAQAETDDTDNHAGAIVSWSPPRIESIRFLGVGTKNWGSGTLKPVDRIFAGEKIVVEADLNRPLCISDPKHTPFPELAPYFQVEITDPEVKQPTFGGPMILDLNLVPNRPLHLRTNPMDSGFLLISPGGAFPSFDQKNGTELVARRKELRTKVLVQPYPHPVKLRLRGLDAFDRPLPFQTREIKDDASFQAELKFLDGRGPLPEQDELVIGILAQGQTPPDPEIPQNEREDWYYFYSSEKLTLTKKTPGHYVSPVIDLSSEKGKDYKTAGVTKQLTADYAYARPYYDEMETLRLSADRNTTIKLITEPATNPHTSQQMLRMGTWVRFEVTHKGVGPDSGEVTVVVIGRKKGSHAIVTRTQLQARKTQAKTDDTFRALTAPIVIGPDGPLHKLHGGDEFRGYVADYDKKTPWNTIEPIGGEPLAIQVLGIEASNSSKTEVVTLGSKFQVRLTFKQDAPPTASKKLAVTIDQMRGGQSLGSRTLDLAAHSSNPNIFLSEVLSTVPNLFPGSLEPQDLIRTTYVHVHDMHSDYHETKYTGQATITPPKAVVKKITLAAGKQEGVGTSNTVPTDGAFQAIVDFEKWPHGGPGSLDLRVVRAGKTIAEFTADLHEETEWDNNAVSAPISLANDRRLGTLVIGDRIEARYGKGPWAPHSSAVLAIVGSPGKVAELHFLLDGKKVTELPVGADFAVEVIYEKAPQQSADKGSVTLETEANFRSIRYRSGHKQHRLYGLSANSHDLRRAQTQPVLLAGATPPHEKKRWLNVMPGFRLTASVGGSKVSASIVPGKISDNEANLTVTASTSSGQADDIDVIAQSASTQKKYHFLTKRPVNLPADTYRIEVHFPHIYSTEIQLNPGESRTLTIPKNDLGLLEVDLRDGKNSRVTPGSIKAIRTASGPKGWADSGSVRMTSIFNLPKGTYTITVNDPNYQKFDFKNVTIQGGETTPLKVGHQRGQLKLTLLDVKGEVISHNYRIGETVGRTSGKAVDVVPGNYDVSIEFGNPQEGSFQYLLPDIRIQAGKTVEQTIKMGQIDIVATGVNSQDEPGSPISLERLNDEKNRKGWKLRSGFHNVLPGTYRVKFLLAAETHDIRVEAGQTVEVRQTSAMGELRIETDLIQLDYFTNRFDYYVKKDGQHMMKVHPFRDFSRYPLHLAEGNYEIQAIAPNGITFRESAKVIAPTVQTVTFDTYGLIQFYNRHEKHSVQIRTQGGNFVHLLNVSMENSEYVPLPPGRYDLRIVAENGQKWDKKIEIVMHITTKVRLPRTQ